MLDNKNKVLLFDGISGVSLAKDIHKEILNEGYDCSYVSGATLKKKKLLKPRTMLAKLSEKILSRRQFYYFPKVNDLYFLKVLEEIEPDIVLVVGFLYRFINLNLVRILREKKGVKFVLYDTDSCNLFPYQREFIYFLENELTVYDQIFSFSKIITNFYSNVKGLNATHSPFGSVAISKGERRDKDIDVLFVGSADMRRVFLLEKLAHYNIAIFGSRWQRFLPLMSNQLQKKIENKNVWEDELYKLLKRSKIILNITRSSFFGVETGVSLRIPETLAAGEFLLTDHTDELAEQYAVGKVLETYKTSSELLQKVNYFLEHSEARGAIAQQGYNCWIKDYSWSSRVKDMLSKINI